MTLRRWTASFLNWSWERVMVGGRVNWQHPRAARFGAVGEGSWLAFPPGVTTNPHAVHIGRQCFIGAGVTLAVGMPTEIYPPDCDPVIEIGDRTTLGKDCWIVARHSVILEDDVTVAPNVYFTDHNHTYADPWLPVGQQILQGASVRVGAGTWIGTNVVVLPGAVIGRNCAIAAGSIVRGEIPDHSVVAGAPARVVRRWTERTGWDPPLRTEVVVPDGWPVGVPPPPAEDLPE